MFKYVLWLTAAASLTGIMSPAARADDAYICDGGRLVYARPETIEKLKQSDPCIQGYYGAIGAASASAAAATNLAPAAPPKVPGILVPAPDQSARNQPPSVRQPALKGGTRDAALPAKRPKTAQAKTPEAAPGTDFRNVRVINAPAAGGAVYVHDR